MKTLTELKLPQETEFKDYSFLKNLINLLAKEAKNEKEFLYLIFTKGIACLTYQYLKNHPTLFFAKEDKLQTLKIFFLSTLAKNSYYQEELKEVLSALAENNIAVIPLKGIILSQRLYGNITCRDESVDFDLLIKEEDKEKAKGILEDLGYSFRKMDEIGPWQWFYIFYKPKGKMIELHWDITMMCRSQERIKGLWQGTELNSWEGIKYYDFKPEELLLYLCAHLVNSDSFRTLRAICDISAVLEKHKEEIDWQDLVKKAEKWRLCASLYAGLKLSRDLFKVGFPYEIPDKLKISLPKRLFILFFPHKRVVLKGGRRRKIIDKFLSYILLELFEADTLKEYLNVFKRVFFPPKEALRNRSYTERLFHALASLPHK
jgi:hypothetical protein